MNKKEIIKFLTKKYNNISQKLGMTEPMETYEKTFNTPEGLGHKTKDEKTFWLFLTALTHFKNGLWSVELINNFVNDSEFIMNWSGRHIELAISNLNVDLNIEDNLITNLFTDKVYSYKTETNKNSTFIEILKPKEVK